MMQLTLEALFEEIPQKAVRLEIKTERRLIELMAAAIIEVYNEEKGMG